MVHFLVLNRISVKGVFARIRLLHIVTPNKSRHFPPLMLIVISAPYSESHILTEFSPCLFNATHCFSDCYGSAFSSRG